MNETVSLEVAIEVVLRNGPNFETIAGLCKMAVEAEREACAKVVDENTAGSLGLLKHVLRENANAIRARSQNDGH